MTKWNTNPIHKSKMFLLIALFFTGQIVFAQEKVMVDSKINPLVGLPSKPGAHIETIKAMSSDSWLDLGSPAADPKWGKGRGRAYSPKMAYASDLGGAFSCGTGVHGYVKPDGHYMDDLFFYDVFAHRWICLYPGANKDTKLKLDEHGFEVTSAGVSQPVSYLSHAYNNLTYLPKEKKLMIIYTFCGWWWRALPQRAEWLEIPEKDFGNAYRVGKLKSNIKYPIFWNVDKNCFEQQYVEGDGPNAGRFEGILEYLPTTKKAMFIFETQPWFFDQSINKWDNNKAPKGPQRVYSALGCYDSKRDRVYSLVQEKLSAYNVKTNQWESLADCPIKAGSVSYAQINYDSVSDVLAALVWTLPKEDKSKLGAYIYDPVTNKWTEPAKEMPIARGCGSAFYSAELNAHFIHKADDSIDNGKVLVYRYKTSKESK